MRRTFKLIPLIHISLILYGAGAKYTAKISAKEKMFNGDFNTTTGGSKSPDRS